jgi:DNA-binding response OmpR family regulator
MAGFGGSHSRVRTPMIAIFEETRPEAKVKALGIGAEDYVVSPLGWEELAARMNAIIRRSNRQNTFSSTAFLKSRQNHAHIRFCYINSSCHLIQCSRAWELRNLRYHHLRRQFM